MIMGTMILVNYKHGSLLKNLMKQGEVNYGNENHKKHIETN